MFVSGFLGLLSSLCFFSGYVSDKKSFPKPLDSEKEKELLQAMWAGDPKAKEELIKHNMRLVVHIVKKYNNYYDNGELISVGSIGLMKAISTYALGKGTQLATYSARCIENEILMTLRANKKFKANKSLYEPISFDKEGNEVTLIDILSQDEESVLMQVENSIIKEKLEKILKEQLQKREYEILCLRFGLHDGDVHTQKEVAKIYKISRSYVSRIESKALAKLKMFMQKNQLFF